MSGAAPSCWPPSTPLRTNAGAYSAYPQLGPAIGFALGNFLYLILSATMSTEAFGAWGWRIPFWASAALLAVGFYIRMKIAETPVFQAAVEAKQQARVPFLELLRRQPVVLVLATLSFILAFTMFYTITTFCLSYGTSALHIDNTTMLTEASVASLLMGAATLCFASVSDRVGRRKLCITAAVLSGVWAFPLFWLIDTRQPVLIVGLVCFALLYGPMGAYFPELFRVRHRYSGASFAYSAAGILGGGISPLIATDVLARTHSTTGVSWYLITIAVLCLVCLLFMGETRTADFTDHLLSEKEVVGNDISAPRRPRQRLTATATAKSSATVPGSCIAVRSATSPNPAHRPPTHARCRRLDQGRRCTRPPGPTVRVRTPSAT